MTSFLRGIFSDAGRFAFKWIDFEADHRGVYSDSSQDGDSLAGIFHVVEPDYEAAVEP